MRYIPTYEREAYYKGYEEGKVLGKELRKKIVIKQNIAKELIKRGIDFTVISESTGFSKEEIESLAAKERELYLLGKEIGIKKGKFKIASEMLKDGLDSIYVSSYTGLPIEEVESIPDMERDSFHQGELDGINEGKKETAREMQERGVNVSKISTYTGIPIKEIEMLTVAVR